MTLVKICGITNLEDALAAVAAAPMRSDFTLPSPRLHHSAAAREIIKQLPGSVLTVGVFVNEDSPQAVMNIANEGSKHCNCTATSRLTTVASSPLTPW